ncbi:MAG TPA: Ppx/GppA phosphatase family protein [Gemmatimonadales bacterium]|nr:Ppx/GppA phosphatase family protein [Gemmatimonadales bacterium]
MSERLGAIDVGSNSIRLLVAEYDPAAGLTIIDEVKDQPRLAAGLAATRRLDPAAVERAMTALARMREVCRRRGVRRLSAVATAAVREAADGPAFLERVRRELDIPLRVIDAETEASLSWRSVAHHFRLAGARTLVADIGGGSLELIGAVDGLVELTTSLPLGAVRVTERWLAEATEPRGTLKRVRRVRKAVRRLLKDAVPLAEWRGAQLIGSGGTFTTLARMALARRGGAVPSTVHGVSVSAAEVEHLLEWLAAQRPEARRQAAGLNPERADIIVAGLAVTAELLEVTEARAIVVSAFGLREGLLLEMAGAEVAPRTADPLRLVREFVERCQSDRRHVEHVRHLALQLFDQLAPALGAGPEERALLEAASLLHDVGQLVSFARHHRHSYQLIMHAERLDLAARDRALVALVARFHRKRGPSRKRHPEFAALPAADQRIVRRLSGLLRIADGLDRGHTAAVERVTAELGADALVLRVAPRLATADLALEIWGAEQRTDVLAKALDRPVEIRHAMA